MQRFFARFGDVIWTALLSLVSGCAALIAAITGASIEIVAGLGLYGIILAILSPRA
jgi:hypothetical protein